MNLKLFLLALPIAIFAVACADGAGATDPEGSGAVSTTAPQIQIPTVPPTTATGLGGVVATAVPRATASLPTTRPTSTPQPTATTAPRPVLGAPSPRPTTVRQPTATPIRIDPFATPTPLWDATATRVPTSTPVPQATATSFVPATIVPADPENRFETRFDYQYDLPSGWSEVWTESELVLVDGTGKVTVSISEQSFEPWRFPTVVALGISLLPREPNDWEEWIPTIRRAIKSELAYEFRYIGTKNSQEYLQIVHWYVWGDVRVQVSAEVPVFDWEESAAVQRTLQTLLDDFQPHDGTPLFTSSEVLSILAPRMDDRPSAIFARDEIARARYELTCRDIYEDLLRAPVHFGSGLWQMSAQTLSGLESWRVFEPGGSVIALDSNESVC